MGHFPTLDNILKHRFVFKYGKMCVSPCNLFAEKNFCEKFINVAKKLCILLNFMLSKGKRAYENPLNSGSCYSGEMYICVIWKASVRFRHL